jgi:hypothetical protein
VAPVRQTGGCRLCRAVRGAIEARQLARVIKQGRQAENLHARLDQIESDNDADGKGKNGHKAFERRPPPSSGPI